jgi:hypothetical protein
VLGFPIRTSADRCLVDGSPQLFAVTHVLHRFLAPRHPPLALHSLEFNFVRKNKDARACSAVLKVRRDACGAPDEPGSTQRRRRGQPRKVGSLKTEEKTVTVVRSLEGRPEPSTSRSSRQPTSAPTGIVSYRTVRMSVNGGETLLRKEVIQPHLPVRLPCYDFTPITDPTFDGSLPDGLGHRLRVLPTFVV